MMAEAQAGLGKLIGLSGVGTVYEGGIPETEADPGYFVCVSKGRRTAAVVAPAVVAALIGGGVGAAVAGRPEDALKASGAGLVAGGIAGVVVAVIALGAGR